MGEYIKKYYPENYDTMGLFQTEFVIKKYESTTKLPPNLFCNL